MNSKTPINVVLCGCGAVGKFFYAPSLLTLAQAGWLNVEWLVDPVAENRAALASLFPAAKTAAALDSLAMDGRLVIVASPPKFHAPQTIHALEKGASVLCEKPMASTSAEAEAMIDAARKNRGILAVGLYKRFFPACESVKGILEKKPMGRLKQFTVQEGGKFGWHAASDSFFRKSLTPGGVLLDIGVHVFDLLLWWLGEPADFVYEDDAMGGQEANCQLELAYPDGCKGQVRISRDWETPNEYAFHFERGTVHYRVNEANRLEIITDGMTTLLAGELKEFSAQASRTNSQSFIEQIRNVIAAMHRQESLRVPGDEGIRSLRFIEQCYQQRRLMDLPWLTPRETARAKVLAGVSEAVGTK